ncbi:MAG: iron-sulfur cluster assembly protein, partial [Gammaproteobacteria bacterium]
MSTVTREQVQAELSSMQDANLLQDLVSAGAVKDIVVQDGRVDLRLELGYPAAGYHAELAGELKKKIMNLDGVREVKVEIGTAIVAHAVQR